MSTKERKRIIIKVLLIVFTILAVTGFGVILQTVLRQYTAIKQNRTDVSELQDQTEAAQTDLNELKEQEETLIAQVTEAAAQVQAAAEQTSDAEPQAGAQESLNTLPELQTQVENYLQQYQGNWAVYVKNLSTQEAMAYNGDLVLKSASLMKLFIMASVYDQINQGTLEQTEEINTLLHNMITVSDNASSNTLTAILGGDRENGFESGVQVVNNYLAVNGYSNTSFAHDFQDNFTGVREVENLTTAVDCGKFMEAVYNGTVVSGTASQEMLQLLRSQTRSGKIPAGLPAGAGWGNKTGEVTGTENDAAIIFPPNGPDYVLVVLSQDVDNATAQSVIPQLSSMVYNYLTGSASQAVE